MTMKQQLPADDELLILRLWATAMEVEKQLGPDKIGTVRGLDKLLAGISKLPSRIGWGDLAPPRMTPQVSKPERAHRGKEEQ